MNYGGDSFYVQINKEGNEEEVKDDLGKKFKLYTYVINAYQKDGKAKKVEFTADHNLRKEAYLKLTINSTKGLTSWEEVRKTEVPKKAFNKLYLV